MFPSMSMMTPIAGNPMPMTQATWRGEPNEEMAEEPMTKPRKRKRSPSPQVSTEEESSDSEDEDPDAYYHSNPKVVHKTVQEFMGKTFHRCIPKRKRLDLAKLYPKPDLPESAAPKLDHDIKGALSNEISDHNDLQLAKVQATILASSAPATNFWSHLLETDLTGKEDMIPASEVIKVLKDTLALLGNASNYVSQARRRALIQVINKSRPKLGSFLKDICKDNLGNTGTELFGVEVRKRITERATTIENFNKAIATVDGQGSSKSSGNRFLSKRPSAQYGSKSGGTKSYFPYNQRNKSKKPGNSRRNFSQNQLTKKPTDRK